VRKLENSQLGAFDIADLRARAQAWHGRIAAFE